MKRLIKFKAAIAFMSLSLAIGPASAHEFWLEPADFHPAAGAMVAIDIRVGQNFKGDTMPFIPARFAAFSITDANGSRPAEGTTGDIPALRFRPDTGGLQVVTYVSIAERIHFTEMAKFAEYLALEGLNDIRARHALRGLPEDRITELYTRCAKTLVMAGANIGQPDRTTGMRLELVALDNPYGQPPGSDLRFALLWEGKPLPDTQLALFHRASGGGTTRLTARTGTEGIASFATMPDGVYLVSAVHMIEAEANRNAHWESYWASLTFGYPAD